MYSERLNGLQARIVAYQEKTRDRELVWRPTVPVPTNRHSELYDFFFTHGQFDVRDGDGARVSLFTKNQNHRRDLRDPQAYMLLVSR